MSQHIAIVGAGIIGMTNAVYLLNAGYAVTVFTKDAVLQTNSDVAVANWFTPDDSRPILREACLASLEKFTELNKIANSGISYIQMPFYFKTQIEMEKSVWMNSPLKTLLKAITDFPVIYRQCKDFPFITVVQLPLIEVALYRQFLLNQFEKLNGQLIIKSINKLNELTDEFNIVINCSGWQAKYLTTDEKIYPARGQLEVINDQHILRKLHNMSIPSLGTYLVLRPQLNDCVLGTTSQANDTNIEPRLSDKNHIINKVAAMFPEIQNISTHSKVGLRAGRSDLRLEAETIITNTKQKSLLIHCYGHGGSGFSASWGSAKKVYEILQNID